MTQNAENERLLPADCPRCRAEFESDWMAQIHYRTRLEEAGPEAAYEAINEDFAEEHLAHIDGSEGV